MCRYITEGEYNYYWEKKDGYNITLPISDRIFNLFKEEVIKIENFYGVDFNEKNLRYVTQERGDYVIDKLEYYRLNATRISVWAQTLFIRFIEIEDDFYLIDFNDHNIQSFHFVCDQDYGIKEFADTVIPLIKKEYEKFNMKWK